MPDPISLHVLCRGETISAKGLVPIDKSQHIYDSISWRISEDQIDGLIGKPFFMHESKSSPSYFGGNIIQIVRRPIEDNDGEIRAVVRFQATKEAKGIKWPPTDNPNEYHRVNLDAPLERSALK